MKHLPRRMAGAVWWLRPAALTLFHGLLLYGVFRGSPRALSAASYLRVWPLAEIIALIVTPYLMLLTVRHHERALWERLLWVPGILLIGGVSGTVRLLRATWLYVLACVPVLLVEHTTDEANAGCARSAVNGVLLVALAAVFEDRPGQWPVGTLVGRSMAPDVRPLANSMAFATAYFALMVGVEFLFERARQKAAARIP